MSIAVYVAVMAGVTYLIRMLPFTFFRKKITSRFWLSFLHYIPYAVLSAMTIPEILYSTGASETVIQLSSVVGTIAALIMAYFELPLIVVALGASLAAFLTALL